MKLDSYKDAGLLVSAELVNELASNDEREMPPPAREAVATLSRILAIDPPSVAQLTQAHVPAFAALARRIRTVFAALHSRNVDAAADDAQRAACRSSCASASRQRARRVALASSPARCAARTHVDVDLRCRARGADRRRRSSASRHTASAPIAAASTSTSRRTRAADSAL